MKAALKIAGVLMLAALLAATAQCAENSTEKARIMASEGIKTVQVGDIEMAYKVMGQGELLVMIMGAGATMDWWPQEFLDGLSSKYRVVVFDKSGHGIHDCLACQLHHCSIRQRHGRSDGRSGNRAGQCCGRFPGRYDRPGAGHRSS